MTTTERVARLAKAQQSGQPVDRHPPAAGLLSRWKRPRYRVIPDNFPGLGDAMAQSHRAPLCEKH